MIAVRVPIYATADALQQVEGGNELGTRFEQYPPSPLTYKRVENVSGSVMSSGVDDFLHGEMSEEGAAIRAIPMGFAVRATGR